MVADKGFYGVDYRSQIGLHRSTVATVGSSVPEPTGSDPSWDVYIGPLPFLLANGPERPYLRESTPSRRDRFDQSREAGENSLDSNLWLRSQTSWHLGAGQRYTEPMEEEPDITRFRYYRSGGIDPWTPGMLTMLHETTSIGTSMASCVGVPNVGVITTTTTGLVRKYQSNGTSVDLYTGNSVSKLAVNSTYWYAIGPAGLAYGYHVLPSSPGWVANTNLTAVHWGKDRLLVGAGSDFYEITSTTPSFDSVTHTFRDGTVADIDSGASGIYIMVNSGLTSIYVLTVKDDGTLNAPREVATLPRGETGNFLYGYLGRYLVIGTSKGVRIADCGSSTDLPVGPLIVEMDGGCLDAVGASNYLWVTAGSEGVLPDHDSGARTGLYRIDLSNQINSVAAYGDTAAARYPYAADLYGNVSGQAQSVTFHDGKVFFVGSGYLYVEGDTFCDVGWIETGRITFSTSEKKAWLSMNVDIIGDGYYELLADTGDGYQPVTQTEVVTPYVGTLSIDSGLHPAGNWISYLTRVVGDGTGLTSGSPSIQALGLRAIPAPQRTRYVRLPLLCFDSQIDRNNIPVGYSGFGYDRLRDLEELERTGNLIQVFDTRTDEMIRCQIDKITFDNTTPPSRSLDNFGGVVTLTLLTV